MAPRSPRPRRRSGALRLGWWLLLTLVSLPITLLSLGEVTARHGAAPWVQALCALFLGLFLPLTLGDRLLGWFRRDADSATEIRWMTFVLLFSHLAWLHYAWGWAEQRPHRLLGALPALIQDPAGGFPPAHSGPHLPGEEPRGVEEIATAPVPDAPPDPGPQPATHHETVSGPRPGPPSPPSPGPGVPPEEPPPAPPPVTWEPPPPAPSAPPDPPEATSPAPPPVPPTPRRPSLAERLERARARLRKHPPRVAGRVEPPDAPEGKRSPSPSLYPPEEPPPEVARQARSLVQGLSSPREKARAIHDWVARNIAYDIATFRRPLSAGQDPARVFRTRQAVCSGYSRLTRAMLRAVGIESRIVSGWARWDSQSWAEVLEAYPEPFHAWNEVRLGANWVPVDTTWDAGSIDLTRDVFTARFRRTYFAPSPERLAETHRSTRPSLVPPDPENYYYRLTTEEKSALGKAAFAYVGHRAPFRGKKMRLWHHGITARVKGRKREAFVLVQLDLERYDEGCRKVRFEFGRKGWEPRGQGECPADGHLPSGGYEFRE